jgi:thioredoxin reductase/ferredoxin
MIDDKWLTYAFYLVPLLLVLVMYVRSHSRTQRRHVAIRDAARRDGLTEPSSLHPKIDLSRCIGCGSCTVACPEGEILGVIGGKAELIDPSKCIGHGACRAACPEDAITLVFGTETRGVDIPHVKSNFETNVPGIFIAGELGGMGLIRNAIEQGKQAMAAIGKRGAARRADIFDVLIVGAGPAGIAATLAAMQQQLRCVTIEQDSLGGTVAHFPRGKIVMTSAVELPLVGRIKLTETTKEALLQLWQDIERKAGLRINYHERMERIVASAVGFHVTTSRSQYHARSVLLAIGRRGTPRKLDVPGEELPKVVYRLIEPEQYRNQHVLVVGGGDSALEAAVAIAEVAGTVVVLSYRAAGFSRAKEANRARIAAAEKAGNLKVMLGSRVLQIVDKSVRIEQQGKVFEIVNHAVIVCAGGVLPTALLREIGIEVETKYGTA